MSPEAFDGALLAVMVFGYFLILGSIIGPLVWFFTERKKWRRTRRW